MESRTNTESTDEAMRPLTADEKIELAFELWCQGLMPDDLYNLRCEEFRQYQRDLQ